MNTSPVLNFGPDRLHGGKHAMVQDVLGVEALVKQLLHMAADLLVSTPEDVLSHGS